MRLARWISPDILARMRPARTDDRSAQQMLNLMLICFIAVVLLLGFHARLIWEGRL